ncbi:MAG: type II secretion system protein [Solirubrobacterales bacterium]
MSAETNRGRTRGQAGFSLPELLVVVLFLGILTGIAVPSFLAQKDKARDACAKAQLRATYTAAMTYGVGNDSSFAGLDANAVNQIDRSIPTSATGGCAQSQIFAIGQAPGAGASCVGIPDRDSFCVYLRMDSNVSYNIVHQTSGLAVRECYVPADTPRGGCPNTSNW